MLKSKGVKRTLSVIFFLLGQAAPLVPQLLPYVPLLNGLGAALGVTGLVHAGAAAVASEEI